MWELRAVESTGRAVTLEQARNAAAEGRAQRPMRPGTMFLEIWWDRTMVVGHRTSPGGATVWSPEARWWASDDELWVDPDTPLMSPEETTATIVNGELRLVQRGAVKEMNAGHDGLPPEQLYSQHVMIWYRVDE
jgi:hypothetical protein